MTNPWFDSRIKCPACTSSTFQKIYEAKYDESPIKEYLHSFYTPQGKVEYEYLDGAFYILCECNGCGMIFQRDIPNETLMERLYEHWIDPKITFSQYLNQTNLEYYSRHAQEVMQMIAYFQKIPSQLNVLDFGMGWGQWALMAKAFGCHLHGTELSQERIKHAESNGIKIIHWDEIPHYHFDFINTEQVFEHISEPLNTLLHLKTALKADGIIKISVPNAHDIKRRLKIMDWKSPKQSKNSLNPVAPLEHINCFRRSSLLKMAESAGMKEVVVPIAKQYQYTTNWSGIRNIAKNLLMPIYRNFIKQHHYILLQNR